MSDPVAGPIGVGVAPDHLRTKVPLRAGSGRVRRVLGGDAGLRPYELTRRSLHWVEVGLGWESR